MKLTRETDVTGSGNGCQRSLKKIHAPSRRIRLEEARTPDRERKINHFGTKGVFSSWSKKNLSLQGVSLQYSRSHQKSQITFRLGPAAPPQRRAGKRILRIKGRLRNDKEELN